MRLADFPAAIDRFGFSGAMKLFTARRRLRRVLPTVPAIRVRGWRFPFHFRNATTDKYVILDVLAGRQYGCLCGAPDVRTIIDAGANIGTASVFLLNAYPDATVIALEPDPGNFAILAKNLSYYGRRAIALQCALWHRSERLTMDRGHFRDGGEWSFQVRPQQSIHEEPVKGVTLAEVVDQWKLERIDILKIDIEGAERQVFASTPESIDRVSTIAIELHDPECRRGFQAAMAGFKGRTTQVGDVTLWRRDERTT